MPRKKIYDRWEIPYGVVQIVCSVCCDYSRRDKAISYCTESCSVLDEYRRLNGIIDNALGEIEVGVRSVIFDDIKLSRGYMCSPCSALLAKNTYYNRKRKLIHDIAVGLNLIQ